MADVTVEIGLELKDINSKLDRLEGNLEKRGKDSGEAFGKEFRTSFGKIFAGNVLANLVSNGLTAAFRGLTSTISEAFSTGIEAAQAQEDSINRLNNALRTSGDFSQEASRDFQDFASELQKVTRFGDEVVLNNLALAKSFGATNEQAKEIASAAADLSAAFGIDLESATRNVAKTLGGFAGELGEVIPELKDLDQAALQSGAGIDLLAQRFSGAASRDVLTFSGAIDQLRNSYGDFLERTGEIITKNPIVITFINKLSKAFGDLQGDVENFVKEFNLITDVLNPLANVAQAINSFVVAPIEIAIGIFGVLQQGLNTAVAGIVAAFGQIAGSAGKLIAFFRPDSELAQGLNDFAETSKQVFTENAQSTNEALETLLSDGNTAFSDSLNTRIEQFRTFNQELAAEAEIQNENLVATTQNVANRLTEAQQAALEAQKKIAEQGKKNADQANKTISGGLAKGISGGIQNIVSSLANGENAFANFGKFILTTFGDLAIQLGSFFIAQGIAIEALNSISGTGAIAAGAGLVALGAILKSFAGSGGGGSGGSSVSGGSGVTATDAGISAGLAEPDAIATAAEEQQSVTINIEGSLVQQEELGDFISSTLNDVKDRRGAVLT